MIGLINDPGICLVKFKKYFIFYTLYLLATQARRWPRQCVFVAFLNNGQSRILAALKESLLTYSHIDKCFAWIESIFFGFAPLLTSAFLAFLPHGVGGVCVCLTRLDLRSVNKTEQSQMGLF